MFSLNESGQCAIRKRGQEVTLYLRGLLLMCWCCLSADEDCRFAAAGYEVAGDGAQSLGDATGHADPAEERCGSTRRSGKTMLQGESA